jgi:hypothetical protein
MELPENSSFQKFLEVSSAVKYRMNKHSCVENLKNNPVGLKVDFTETFNMDPFQFVYLMTALRRSAQGIAFFLKPVQQSIGFYYRIMLRNISKDFNQIVPCFGKHDDAIGHFYAIPLLCPELL